MSRIDIKARRVFRYMIHVIALKLARRKEANIKHVWRRLTVVSKARYQIDDEAAAFIGGVGVPCV